MGQTCTMSIVHLTLHTVILTRISYWQFAGGDNACAKAAY
jgi:hypothetical protein